MKTQQDSKHLDNAARSTYSEDNKFSLLKNSLNQNIISRLVGSDLIRKWSGFVSKVHNLISDLVALTQPQYFDQTGSSKRQDESSEIFGNQANLSTLVTCQLK